MTFLQRLHSFTFNSKYAVFYKLGIFVMSYLLVVNIISSNLCKPCWGNADLRVKMDSFNDHQSVNTVFIGSSKVYRHIIPSLFDSLTSDQISSFNLGMSGVYFFESLKLIDELISKKNSHSQLKRVFFLHQNPTDISRRNKNSLKAQYPYSWKYAIDRIRYYGTDPEQNQITVNQFFKNLFGVHLFKCWSTKYESKIGKNIWENGYISLEKESKNESRNIRLAQREKSLRKAVATRQLKNIKIKERKVLNKNLVCDIYKELHERLEDAGIELYIIQIPEYELPDCLNSKIHVLNMTNFKQYRRTSLRFDRGHLNERGAELFTVKLAKKFLNLERAS